MDKSKAKPDVILRAVNRLREYTGGRDFEAFRHHHAGAFEERSAAAKTARIGAQLVVIAPSKASADRGVLGQLGHRAERAASRLANSTNSPGQLIALTAPILQRGRATVRGALVIGSERKAREQIGGKLDLQRLPSRKRSRRSLDCVTACCSKRKIIEPHMGSKSRTKTKLETASLPKNWRDGFF